MRQHRSSCAIKGAHVHRCPTRSFVKRVNIFALRLSTNATHEIAADGHATAKGSPREGDYAVDVETFARPPKPACKPSCNVRGWNSSRIKQAALARATARLVATSSAPSEATPLSSLAPSVHVRAFSAFTQPSILARVSIPPPQNLATNEATIIPFGSRPAPSLLRPHPPSNHSSPVFRVIYSPFQHG